MDVITLADGLRLRARRQTRVLPAGRPAYIVEASDGTTLGVIDPDLADPGWWRLYARADESTPAVRKLFVPGAAEAAWALFQITHGLDVDCPEESSIRDNNKPPAGMRRPYRWRGRTARPRRWVIEQLAPWYAVLDPVVVAAVPVTIITVLTS